MREYGADRRRAQQRCFAAHIGARDQSQRCTTRAAQRNVVGHTVQQRWIAQRNKFEPTAVDRISSIVVAIKSHRRRRRRRRRRRHRRRRRQPLRATERTDAMHCECGDGERLQHVELGERAHRTTQRRRCFNTTTSEFYYCLLFVCFCFGCYQQYI